MIASLAISLGYRKEPTTTELSEITALLTSFLMTLVNGVVVLLVFHNVSIYPTQFPGPFNPFYPYLPWELKYFHITQQDLHFFQVSRSHSNS